MNLAPKDPGGREKIPAIEFRPPRAPGSGWGRTPGLPAMLFAVAMVTLVAGLWFVFTARAVTFLVEPEADSIRVSGGLSLPFAGRRLMRPGEYVVVAERRGYHRLVRTIEVPAGADPTFRLGLAKLPGRLSVASTPSPATVTIDDEPAGKTPTGPVTLEPGIHRLVVSAPRHRRHESDVEIEGRGVLQALEVPLTPAWAPVTFRSEPAGALLTVDGEPSGTTPLTTELGEGTRRVALSLAGYEDWQRELEVVADEPREVPLIRLERARGIVRLASDPSPAEVTVAGEFRGRTPITVALPPEVQVVIRIGRAGYEPAVRELSVPSGEERTLRVELRPVLGTIRIRAAPVDATLFVDGEPHGPANQELSLPAAPHRIAIRKAGYEPYERIVTPRPGFEQKIEATLLTEGEARLASIPRVIATPAGDPLRLVPPGEFRMGAPRREQGRRANEIEREVRLTRPFYISAHEVTNRSFRAFRAGHSSGIIRRRTLDNDDMPVVRVGWNDAVAYCNWLSERAGLAPAYAGGRLRTPVGNGFRLPTEAEWEWAARRGGDRWLRYPWGDRMPPTGEAGNFADVSAAGILTERLRDYDDGFPATAPVGRFAPNAFGLFDLGGNVSEWIHDFYGSAPQGETASDPLGPGEGFGHVVRGSSWRHGRIAELRLSWREQGSGPRDDLGFRVARYAD